MSAQADGTSNSDELRQIFAAGEDPVFTAVEVAEKLGITQQAAYARLARAAESGDMKRKKVGSRAVVWWFPDQVSDSL